MPIHQVIQSDGMSAVIKANVCECNQCGFRWIQQGKKKPQRCPSRECRSIAWDEPKRPKRKYERKPGRPRKRGPGKKGR